MTDEEYLLAATLRVTETRMGKGDGTYAIGPGDLRIRVDRRTGHAHIFSYRLTERFTVQTAVLLWTTTVLIDAGTHASSNRCAVAAEGTLSGQTLRWTTPVRGYATDGVVTCAGILCGLFGAPPPGRSEIHTTDPVTLAPFTFDADGTTFTMPYTFVLRTETPRQTAYLALAGRRVERACARGPVCAR